MIRKLVSIGFLLGCFLTGCASTPLDLVTGAIGSKPEITAQAGAENTKQAVGLNNKVDASTEVSNDLKNSKVDNLDTSTSKKISASSISASTITAERIEIRNNDGDWKSTALIVSILIIVILGCVVYIFIRLKRKAP